MPLSSSSSSSLVMVLLLSSLQFVSVLGDRREPPAFKFDVYNIKTPQLIGIIVGCIVFSATLTSVVVMLHKSGTFDRLKSEISSGEGLKVPKARLISPQISQQPELYDSLVEAANSLPLKLVVPILKEKSIVVRSLADEDLPALFAAGNGDAFFTESAYDPERLWGWLPNFTSPCPYSDLDTFKKCMEEKSNCRNVAIVDADVDRVVGMASLVSNSPKNLSIQIDNIWLTPAYQGKQYGHVAVLLLCQWLFGLGYRRISAEVDSRHLIGRKFCERCGFKMEGILRKHRIVRNRNRDSALYVLLNSEWQEVSLKLKKHLGIDTKPKTIKLAAIDEADKLFPTLAPPAAQTGHNKSSVKTNKKKNVKKKK